MTQVEGDTLSIIGEDVYLEPAGVVGDTMEEVASQFIDENNHLPLEGMPVIDANIEVALKRLFTQLNMPGVNRAEIERRIRLLIVAKDHVAEAAAGLAAARNHYAAYLGEAAVSDTGQFKF